MVRSTMTKIPAKKRAKGHINPAIAKNTIVPISITSPTAPPMPAPITPPTIGAKIISREVCFKNERKLLRNPGASLINAGNAAPNARMPSILSSP